MSMLRRFATTGVVGVLLAASCATSLKAGTGDVPAGGGRGEAAAGPTEARPMPRPGGPGGPSGTKYQDFQELIKDSKTHEGFFTLHEKDQHLYAEIKPQQLDQPILAPIMIARGFANAGQPLNFGDEWVLTFRRVGDKLQLIRKNIHFTAPAGTPLELSLIHI